MLNLKCQFWYLPQGASLARIGSHIIIKKEEAERKKKHTKQNKTKNKTKQKQKKNKTKNKKQKQKHVSLVNMKLVFSFFPPGES